MNLQTEVTVPPTQVEETIQCSSAGHILVPSASSAQPLFELKLSVGVKSSQGRRPSMEDTHTVISQFIESNLNQPISTAAFFGVYDGHGGRKAAEYAQDNFHSLLKNHPDLYENPQVALKESILQLESSFLSIAKKHLL